MASRRTQANGKNGHGETAGGVDFVPEPIDLTDTAIDPDASDTLLGEFETPVGEGIIDTAGAVHKKRIAGYLHELRPSVATGGSPVMPVILLGLLNASDELDQEVFGVLIPEIRDWFGVDISFILGLITLSLLFRVLAAIPLGYLADRLNRTKMTAAGAFVWALFTLCTGLAPGLLLLAISRFGSGLGKSMDPAHSSLIADYYPPNRRAAVFAFHGMGNPLGKFIGPLLGGALASWTGLWQVPFLVFAVPSFILAVLMLVKMREPVRGEQERRALGADEETIYEKEPPPSWAESFRIAWNVRTLRRIWFGLPFVVGSAVVILPLLSELYDQKFGLGPGARGVLAAIDQPAAFVGLIFGAAIANRLLRFRPGRVVTMLGVLCVLVALTFVIIALTPFLPVVVAASVLRAFFFALLGPGAATIMSICVPPRVRSFAVGMGAVWIAAGLVPAYFVGGLADSWGIERAILAMSFVFAIGALIWSTAGAGVEPDMRAAMAASMAAQEARRAKESGQAKLLVCRDIDVNYGNVQILFNVDFDVEEGEIVALLGTNGAGKSTLLRAISGLTPPANGAIFFDGENITYLPAHEHAARGIIMVSGGKGVFPTLSVNENLRLSAWLFRKDDEYVKAATEKVFEFFPVLRARQNEMAGNMSGGEQQMLTLAQAFLSRPRLLMIDELSLGLAPQVVERLLGIVKAIHANGTTVILVEQSVNVALTVAERAVFMEKGEVRFSGPTSELLERNDVLRSVFLKGAGAGMSAGGGGGGPIGAGSNAVAAQAKKRPTNEKREVLLDVRDVRKSFGGVSAINGISLTLEENTILGLIGPNGAGKTTLFDLISGFLIPDTGTIRFLGEDITSLSPDARAQLGLQRSFQDARLFPALTVAENIAVAFERHLETKSAAMAGLHLPNVRKAETKLKKRADRLIEMFGIGDFSNKFVRELSTGSRRIVDLACTLASDPKVLLLDEPSSGVAQRETEELGPLLVRIRYETGCSILVIEHDMPLITSISDELAALELGTVLTRGLPQEVVEHPRVVQSYLGTSEEVIKRSGNVA